MIMDYKKEQLFILLQKHNQNNLPPLNYLGIISSNKLYNGKYNDNT
jgi:hypothetical protein